ncbi:MAG: hypothetical protein A3B37_00375 [Candidatus Sungbacteria bacterium RIFCSPLOWO2_01_FULL_59_16]|uniref:M23ase beta-sheet core domain-containing protein n=1 Tax=Candidatus Sungbacteria bacterium RIFCSPLOWO2_01_FULL_59_16 TaxID=1802280 RepID=A0A1G2LAY7_9BACT|nr:MAG: hypothetical protein A3B37_00375 [Candidatus Sungbacteria bacterium RIFCSPLOWO2_01_FULL_59_16]
MHAAAGKQNRIKVALIAISIVALFTVLTALAGRGVAADETIRRKIEEKSEEIKRLEAEAERYRTTLGDLGREASTLSARVKAIEHTLQRLEANIRLTNAKVERANLEIRSLEDGIVEATSAIDTGRGRLGHFLGLLAERERETPLEIFAKHDSISSFFDSLDQIIGIQANLQDALAELRRSREALRERKSSAETKRLEQKALAQDLADQKAVEIEERRGRSSLLAETRNQERRYQELLADVEKKRSALQEEINALEADLEADFDRSLLPAPGSGVLGWPLPAPIFITQHFGQTAFARAGAYSGKGHNGIDLRAAVGTAVFAGEGGTVRATGDTDLACRRASYGRWVLVDHPSNLTTLYAHLSLVRVRRGDAVNRGELIGYSGQSGYATGPHLHFTVFARQAVNVGELRSRVCGRVMTLPLSPFGGYLNPLDYLGNPA